MADFYLRVDQPIDAQLLAIVRLSAASVIRFDDAINAAEDPRALALIKNIIPHLPADSIFVMDINLTTVLAEAIGARLPENIILKIAFPVVPAVAIAAVKYLGESHTVWFSVEREKQKRAMAKLSPVPIAKIVAAGRPGLKVQLPAYLSLASSVAAVKALPKEAVLSLPADIEVEAAAKLLAVLQPGQKITFSSAMALYKSTSLAALLPDKCGLEFTQNGSKNAEQLVRQLSRQCFVNLRYYQQKASTKFRPQDKELLRVLRRVGNELPIGAFWRVKPPENSLPLQEKGATLQF